MSFWKSILGWFSFGYDSTASPAAPALDDTYCTINPATGLPMVGGCGGVDVGGNPYGMDPMHHDTDTWRGMDWSSGANHDSWDSGSSSWND